MKNGKGSMSNEEMIAAACRTMKNGNSSMSNGMDAPLARFFVAVCRVLAYWKQQNSILVQRLLGPDAEIAGS
ncbi:hypothetical protein D3C73_1125140 [compost metagenome]